MTSSILMASRKAPRILQTIMIVLLALVLVAAISTAAPMAVSADNTGFNSPSANSNAGWDTPQNAYSSDDSRAMADLATDIVQYYNFNLPVIPSDATINGIEVSVEGYQNGGDYPRQADISLSWNNGSSYTIGAGTGVKTTSMPGNNAASEAVRTYGGASDTWGRTWATGDFVNTNFRIKLDTILADVGTYLYIDLVQVKVTYTPASLVISTTSPLTSGTVDAAYSETLTVTGGTPPYTWSVDSGSLPAGLSLTPSNGAITGTPTAAGGPTSITFRVTDSAAATTTKALSITMNKGTPTITWANPADIVYGTALSSTQLCATASLPGTFNYSPDFGALLPAGNGQTLHVDFTPTDSANYNTVSEDVSINVDRTALTITANDRGKTYGDSLTFLGTEFSAAGLAGSDTIDSVTLTSDGTAASATVAGSPYAIMASAAAGTGMDNYDITYVDGALTVGRKVLTITADARSKTYGDTVTFLGTEFGATGLVGSDTVDSLTLTSDGPAAAATVAASPYAIVPSNATGTGMENYLPTYVNGALTVNARNIGVTADGSGKIYGEANPVLTYHISSGSLVPGDAFTGAVARVAGEAAGTYDIQQGTLALNSNYNMSFVKGTFTITVRPIQVTGDNNGKMYGEPDPALTYRVSSGSLAFADAFSGAIARQAGEGLGTYGIQQGTLALNSNYNLTFVDGTFTITVRPIQVTGDDSGKMYGEPDPALTYQITSGSLAFGDTFSGAIARAASEDPSTYDIQQGTLALNSNYSLTFVGGNFTIAVRHVEVTADDSGKMYGEPDPALTYQITSGSLAFGDTLTGDVVRVVGEDVGTYHIQQGTLALNSNYNLTFVDGTFVISGTPLTIIADSAAKTYGNTLTFLGTEFTTIGLKPGDSITSVTLTSDGAATVATVSGGPYSVVPSAALGSGLGQYTIIYANGTLTVSPKPLTITADNRSKPYGATATFAGTEFTTDGLVNADTVTSVTLTSAGAEPAAVVGSYGILPSDAVGTGMDNYIISYAGGSLSVKRAFTNWIMSFSANPSTLGRAVTFTATVTGTGATGAVIFKDGDTTLGSSTLSNGTATYTTSTLSVGTHVITAVYEGDTNFVGSTSSAVDLTVAEPATGANWGLIGGLIAAAGLVNLLLLLKIFRR